MVFWLIIALMTAAATFAVLWPLSRDARTVRSGSDVAVYEDQIEEVERDRKSGLIGDAEAEAARTEVSRRLLAAAEAAGKAEADQGLTWRRRMAAAFVLVALPFGAGAYYLWAGSPNVPDQPLSARAAEPPGHRSIVELITQVEQHLERNPVDARGWEVLAPIYLRLGRFDDAVKARRNVLRISGANAEREADLGEALTAQAQGIVTAEARAAFERSLAHDAKEVKARFFTGIAAEQEGKREDAANIWRGMIAQAPPGANWTGFVREALARVEGKSATAERTPAAARGPIAERGPSAEDMKAAADVTDEQRSQMIRGMVDRLAERLKADSSDLEGWLRLVRAYAVLGERDRASAAASDARKALASEPDKMRKLDEALKGLGIEG